MQATFTVLYMHLIVLKNISGEIKVANKTGHKNITSKEKGGVKVVEVFPF